MEGAEAQEKHRVWRAIMVLVFFTFLHSYVGVSLYAYAGFMVVDLTGGSRNGAGYMTGFMASSSYLGRFLSSCVWGHVADCLGRKPVMIISLTSMLIFPVTFGLARSVDWAVTTRLLLGLTCPGHIVIRTLTPEVAGSSRVVEATGYVSGAIGFAMAVGPAIGGLLAQPTNHFPAIFPSDGLFARYPYLLPNLVSTPLVVICMLLAILFVPETMAATRKGSYGRRPSKSLGRKEYLEVVPTSAASPWATPTPRKPDAKGNGEGLNRVPGGDRSTPGGFVSPSCVGKFLSPAHLRSRASPLSSRARSRVTPPHQATTPATPVGRFSRTPQSGSRQASPHAWGVSITLPPSAHVELPVTPPGSECDVGDGKDLGDDESPDPVTKPTRGGWQLPRVISAVCGTGLMELILTSFDEVYPLWAMSTRDVGGLNWDMVLVGKVFFVSGMVHFLYMFVGYNWIAEKVGVARAHRAAGIVSVVLSAAVPFIGYLDWSVAGIFTISLVLVTLINSTSFMLYNAMVMASTSSVPPKLRGKIAGLMSTGVGLGGFLGPFALSIAFAWSISTSFPASETPLVNQHSAFNVGAILRALLLMLLWKDLTEENLTGVVNDVPVPESLPSLELESIHEDHSTESPGTLAMGNRRVDLV